MSKKYFAEINQKLRDLNLFRAVSTLTYRLEMILKCFTYEQIKQIQEAIESNIVAHYEQELYEKIEEIKERYRYEGDFDDNGYWRSEYEKYFEFDCDGGMFPLEWEIMNDFDVENRELYEDYETLEWILDIDEFNYDKVNGLDFEIMAVQALIYIEDFIRNPSDICHLSNAFLAFYSSEKMSFEFDKKGELLEVTYKLKQEQSEKALNVRHQLNRAVKDQAISDFCSQSELNKDQFAEKNAKKYGYTVKTIREWLKGNHIKNN